MAEALQQAVDSVKEGVKNIAVSDKKQQQPKKEKKAKATGGSDELATPAKYIQDRLDLFDQLKAEYDAEIANEDVQLESGTFSGLGTRNRKRGFLAFGGAAGRPAIVDDGMLQDLDNLETSDDEAVQPLRRVRRTSSTRRV